MVISEKFHRATKKSGKAVYFSVIPTQSEKILKPAFKKKFKL